MPRDVFISYSYADKAVADKVCHALETADIPCWIAPRDERPGETWASKIVRAIDESRIMVLILSKSSNSSKDCTKEVAIATSDDKMMPVIPVRIDDVSLAGDLKYYLAGMHRLDALPPPIESHLERLVTDVRDLLNSLPPLRDSPEPPRAAVQSASVRDMDLERAQEWTEKAERLCALGLDTDALTCYDRALASKPDNVATLNAKGDVLVKLNRHEEALRCFEQATEANPASFDTWKNRGKTLQTIGRCREAVQCFDRALDIEPLDADARGAKCAALLELGEDETALTCCEAATKIDSTSSTYWYFTGLCLEKLGREEESIESFGKAIAIDPNNLDAHSRKAALLARCSRREDAILEYDHMLSIDPNNAQAWFDKGVCLTGLQRHSEAIECYARVRAIDPAHPDLERQQSVSEKAFGSNSLLQQASEFTAANRHREAIECCDKVLASDPHNADAWYRRGLSFASLGNAKEAARCFDRSLELTPKRANGGGGH